jgi:hypothetical protein
MAKDLMEEKQEEKTAIALTQGPVRSFYLTPEVSCEP